jgi:hypothetical protein
VSTVTIQIAGTAIASFIAAFVASWLALRQFRSQRWWEKKVETYTAIFNAMNDLCEEMDQIWDAQVAGRELSDETERSLREAASAAWPEIKRQARLGSFVLSEEAERTLAELLKKLEKSSSADSYFEHIDARCAALDAALKALKAAARADLKT